MRDLLFVGLFALFLANTHAADINDLTYAAAIGDTIVITDCAEDAAGDLVIPDTIGGKPVNYIGRYAFSNCTSLTSITIPDSVTSIGNYAFSGCSNLKSITFGKNSKLTSIGSSAFDGCTSLTSITIPEGVTSIEMATFWGCDNLKSITIPNSVTSIGRSAFAGCTSLTSITIPDGVTRIESYTFSDCTSLTNITIPDSVTRINSYAFKGCSSLSNITIPKSVTRINSYVFLQCSNLKSITIPDTVTSIGYGAFFECVRLKKIRFLGNAPTIGDKVFSYISPDALISISKNANGFFGASFGGIMIEGTSVLSLLSYEVINDKITVTDCDYVAVGDLLIPEIIDDKVVTEIAANAFDGCIRLKSVTLPKSVTSIGEKAFWRCDNLTTIEVGAGNMNFTGDNGVLFNADKTVLVSYPAGKTGSNYTIPDSVTSIGKGSFGTTDLTRITIPDGVTSIGESAFHSCMFLNSITIPDSVTTIGESAFRNCDRMASVTIGNGVKKIERYSFYDCDNLVSLIIPDSVIIIRQDAFRRCDNLLWVTIGDNVSLIESRAFESCSQLTSIRIPESVASIEEGVFYECDRLKNITFDSETAPEISPLSFSQQAANDLVVYVPKNSTGYDAWANPNNYTIESIDPKFENVSSSIVKLDEIIRLSFSVESKKEYYIQRSFDLKHWDFIRSNIFQATNTTVLDSKLIFDEQQQKKALVPTEDIGNEWIQLNYDDSNWLDVESVSEDGSLLRGGVGFARTGTRENPFDPYIALDLEEQMYRTNASVYIRIPFTIDDLSEVNSLTLEARTDDGFVAWINGDKVQSFNAPDEPQWDSEATASHSEIIAITLKEFFLGDHMDKIRVGQNIIAIQALNKGKSGSDFLFSCNLLVNRRVYSTDYPLINSTNQNQLRSQFYRVISQ